MIDWYLETMESGIDTKEVVLEFAKLTKEHNSLKETSHRTILKLEDDVSHARYQLKKTHENLQRQ